MFLRLILIRRLVLLIIVSLCIFLWILNLDNQSKDVQIETDSSLIFNQTLLDRIVQLNANNELINRQKFKNLTDDDLVIVVQVHNRLSYLKLLIDSLSRVKFVDELLLVFSHDFFDENINSLIKSITFCKVTQIFFPFSTQIWLNTFPGRSVGDCARDVSRKNAALMNCTNFDHPDSYGHYRESHVTQTKHHWWWKVNYVFDQLAFTKQHLGDFVLVEEDHYISPDFVHTWKLMKHSKKQLEEEGLSIDILTLGNYDKNYNIPINANKLQLTEWFSGKHNMAFTLDRNLWSKIKLCSVEFCTFDDYNWDWSLQYTSSQCFEDKLMTLVSIVPRVYHIGDCGLHHSKHNCDARSKIDSLNHGFYKQYARHFFPSSLTVKRQKSGRKNRFKNNGGWSDPRDHELCSQYELPFNQIIKTNLNFVKLYSKSRASKGPN